MGAPAGPRLEGLVGRPLDEVRTRLGPAHVEREVGGDRWLLYDYEDAGVSLRIRCRPAAPGGGAASGGPWVASWTAGLREGRRTLREAASALGLWPACAPDADAGATRARLLRRAVHGDGALHSLTARVRGGRIDQLAAYDEAPDW